MKAFQLIQETQKRKILPKLWVMFGGMLVHEYNAFEIGENASEGVLWLLFTEKVTEIVAYYSYAQEFLG